MTDQPTNSADGGPLARYPVRWKAVATYAWGWFAGLWFLTHWLFELWFPVGDAWMDEAEPWVILFMLPLFLVLTLSMKCHTCGYRWPLHRVRDPKPEGCLRCGSLDWGLAMQDEAAPKT